jgi:peptidyl-prolyl cis-trans isomerase SurA
MGIVATVNNTPISEYDLHARLRLVIALSGLPATRQTAEQLAPKVIDTLIDEELKRQEADALDILIPDEAIEEAVRKFEKARNMPSGGLYRMIEQLSISKDVLHQQIRADLSWSDSLRLRFRALTQVSDEEVDEEIARLEAEKGKPVALLSEIFLPVDLPSQQAEVRAVAERIVGELKRGAPFQAMATTFSQSPTAAVGGDLGWVSMTSLAPEVATVVSALDKGAFSQPVRTSTGFSIYWLRDKRVSQGASGPSVDPSIVLQQLTIPVDEAGAVGSSNEKLDLAKRLRLRAGNCTNLNDMPNQVAGGLKADRLKLRTSQLSPLIRDAIKDLEDQQVSEVVKVPGAFMLFMVCERISESGEERLRTRVRNRLIDARLDLASRQFLRDLRRNAFIERR